MQPIINKAVLRIFQFEDALINNLERWGVLPTTFNKFVACNLSLEHENMQVLAAASWNEDGTLSEYKRGSITAKVTQFAQGFHVRRNQSNENVWTEDTHNVAGNLIKSTVHVRNEGSDDVLTEVSFVGVYENGDNLVKETIYTLDLENTQSVEAPVYKINVRGSSVTEYKFNADGKCLGHITDNSDKTDYKYNDAGLVNMISSKYNLGAGGDETVTEDIAITYDDKGNVVKSEKLINGLANEATEFNNSYDENGKLASVTLVPDDLIVLSLSGFYNLA